MRVQTSTSVDVTKDWAFGAQEVQGGYTWEGKGSAWKNEREEGEGEDEYSLYDEESSSGESEDGEIDGDNDHLLRESWVDRRRWR